MLVEKDASDAEIRTHLIKLDRCISREKMSRGSLVKKSWATWKNWDQQIFRKWLIWK